eukprot:SAG31_NODE_28803_length_405_cov_0.647059_1_plen_55_part_01
MLEFTNGPLSVVEMINHTTRLPIAERCPVTFAEAVLKFASSQQLHVAEDQLAQTP